MKYQILCLAAALLSNAAFAQSPSGAAESSAKIHSFANKEQECVTAHLKPHVFGHLQPQAPDVQAALEKCITLATSPKLLKEVVRVRMAQRSVTEEQLAELKAKVGKEVAILSLLTLGLCQSGRYEQGCETLAK